MAVGTSTRGRSRRSATVAVLCLVAALAPGGPAAAATTPGAPTPAAVDDSYYITSSNPQLVFDMGCADGKVDARHGAAQRLTILDFGGQYADGSGTRPVRGPAELTNAQIASLSENYALGWYVCVGSDFSAVLTMGIGTNNSLRDVTGSGGATWAKLVATVANAEAPITERIVVDGANDVETEWSTPAAALSWAAGYTAASTGSYYFDYGDAGGCPQTTADDGACNNGWHQKDVWEVSWGEPTALPLPEIYYPANAAQWAQISNYGRAAAHGAAINFSGDLSEFAADPTTLTPAASWKSLATSLKSASQTSRGTQWLTSIRWETP